MDNLHRPDNLPAFEQRYRALFENTNDAVFLISLEGIHLAVNQRASELTGYAVEELIGMPTSVIVDPSELLDSQRIRERMLAGENIPVYERTFRRKSGEVLLAEVNVSLIRDDQGGPLYIQSIVRDITERKRSELALRDSEERFRKIFEEGPLGMVILGRDQKFLTVNQRFADMLGYSVDELLTLGMEDVTHPDGIEHETGLLAQLFDQQIEYYELEKRYIHKDGHLIWARISRSLIRSATASEVNALALVEDITDRKRAEQAERDQRALAEALRDSAAAMTSTLDLNRVLDRILTSVGRVVAHEFANIMLIENGLARPVGWRGYAEYGLEEQLRQSVLEVSQMPSMRIMVQTKQPIIIPDVEHWPLWKPGWSWIKAYAGAPIVVEGEVIGFLNLESRIPGGINLENGDRLKAFADQAAIAVRNAQLFEKALRRAEELAERNQELDTFSHSVAHDLKAPLQILVGYIGLLRASYGEIEEEDMLQTLGVMQDTAVKLGQIVDSLLLLAGLRGTNITLDVVDMRPVVESALMRFRDPTQPQRIALVVEPDLPPALGYGPWIEEVFANLIANAIKYIGKQNPNPRVIIRGRCVEGMVRYEVEDNGLGIAPDQQARIFEMFSRAHPSEAPGTGLGLSIVRRIINKLGGEVGVISEQGQGSTFWFTLPSPD